MDNTNTQSTTDANRYRTELKALDDAINNLKEASRFFQFAVNALQTSATDEIVEEELNDIRNAGEDAVLLSKMLDDAQSNAHSAMDLERAINDLFSDNDLLDAVWIFCSEYDDASQKLLSCGIKEWTEPDPRAGCPDVCIIRPIKQRPQFGVIFEPIIRFFYVFAIHASIIAPLNLDMKTELNFIRDVHDVMLGSYIQILRGGEACTNNADRTISMITMGLNAAQMLLKAGAAMNHYNNPQMMWDAYCESANAINAKTAIIAAFNAYPEALDLLINNAYGFLCPGEHISELPDGADPSELCDLGYKSF